QRLPWRVDARHLCAPHRPLPGRTGHQRPIRTAQLDRHRVPHLLARTTGHLPDPIRRFRLWQWRVDSHCADTSIDPGSGHRRLRLEVVPLPKEGTVIAPQNRRALVLVPLAGLPAAAAAQELIRVSYSWQEVVGLTTAPVTNPNSILDPGEGARIA